MKIYICDRCGRKYGTVKGLSDGVFKHTKGFNPEDDNKYIIERDVEENDDTGDGHFGYAYLDICPDCEKDLDRWFKEFQFQKQESKNG